VPIRAITSRDGDAESIADVYDTALARIACGASTRSHHLAAS